MVHNNNRLCPNKIKRFMKKLKVASYDIDDETNGSDNLCNVEVLKAKATIESSSSVKLYWEPLKPFPDQRLAGYLINYIVAPHPNVTHFYGKDSCSR